jgi:AcrR family transcriptional regulator
MSPARGSAEVRRAQIVDAALSLFGRYGYRRTSIDDIAREAGIAKGTVYLSFASKDEVFLSVSQVLAGRMLASAETARQQPGTVQDRLTGVTVAWYGTYFDTVCGSPHAAELMDAKHRLCADVISRAAGRFRKLLRDTVADADTAGELDLRAAGISADTAADLLIAVGRGLVTDATTAAACRRHLQALVRVLVAGLRPAPRADD